MSDDEYEVEATPGETPQVPAWPPRRRPLQDGELDPKAWSVELDEAADDDAVVGVPVDPPVEPRTVYGTVLAAKEAEMPPVIPAWLRNRLERQAVFAWALRYGRGLAAYRLSRSPWYAAKLIYRSPRGAWRALVLLVRWVFDLEASSVRGDAIRRADVGEYLALSRQRDERIRKRGLGVVAAAVPLLVGVGLLWWLAPHWVLWLLGVLAVGVLGRVGTNPDRPVLDPVRVEARVRRLTADVVIRALVAAKIAKDGGDLAFPSPIMRDGPGWRATIDLPYGVTVGDVVEKRAAVASGLDLALGQVWPEGVTGGSLRRLILWVGDEDLSQRKPVLWPLIKDGRVDLFAPFRVATDQRGNPVLLLLMFTSVIIGAVPRMGKSFFLRLLLLAAALDVTAELHVYDLRGSADYVPMEPVCHRIGIGDDEELIGMALADLRALQNEMRRRYALIRDLPSELAPEGKVTRALADTKNYRLHPIVIGVDECQVWFTHPEHGKELEELTTDLVKRGPAAGIITMLATQKPDDKSLPTGITDNAGTRMAMRVMNWRVSEMITGSGMSKIGINAASLTRADKGVGYLVGASDDVDAQLVRGDLADANHAKVVVARAVALREGAGGITGQAAGEAVEKLAGSTLLDDVLLVIRGDARIHSEDLCARLAELRPEYRAITPTALAAMLKAAGVETERNLKVAGINRAGIKRDALLAGIASRDEQLSIEQR